MDDSCITVNDSCITIYVECIAVNVLCIGMHHPRCVVHRCASPSMIRASPSTCHAPLIFRASTAALLQSGA
eukprot:367155-Rhodomonas_salina.1